MTITLTQGQEAALKMIAGLKQFKDRPKIAVMAGVAGSGKTYTLSLMPEVLGGIPVILCPTGKAALRVRELAGLPARTIHSFAFHAHENPNTGEVTWTRKKLEELQEDRGEVDVLVIDEASMVDEELWVELFDIATILKVNVLIVGDSFQLPPVKQKKGEREFNLLSKDFCYDVRTDLTEVVRQAKENPIIRASMLIREGDPSQAIFQLPRIPSKDLLTYATSILSKPDADAVILCHKNETRHFLNRSIRSALGKPEGRLVSGEPLLVLQNSYRLQRYNGEIAKFVTWVEEPKGEHIIKDWIRKQEAKTRFGVAQLETTSTDPRGVCSLATEEVLGRLGHISLPPIVRMSRVISGGGSLTVEDAEDMTAEEINERLGPPHLHCNLGYTLSVHKAQGSDWRDVLVIIEPSSPLGTSEGRRHLYTAVTRARESVKICLGAGAAGRALQPA